MTIQNQLRNALRFAQLGWRGPDDCDGWREPGRGEAIVLVHGLLGTPRTFRPLARYLRRVFDRPLLEVPAGLGLGDIRDTASEIDGLLAAREVRRCDLVAYSIGGLVAAYLLKCLDQGRRIRRLVTLGTPHAGVPLAAQWARACARVRPLTQVQVGSRLLEQLARVPVPVGSRLISIAGGEDALVPARSARVSEPRCRNLVVAGIDHWGLLLSRRVFRHTSEALGAEAPLARAVPLSRVGRPGLAAGRPRWAVETGAGA